MLLDAFDSGWVAPLGPHVDGFEREAALVAGREAGAALSSGTAGLHLALHLLGVTRGDTVIVPTATFVGTVNPVRFSGAEPVFVDAEERSWNLDPSLLADELASAARRGAMPAAVVAVDLYGQCADYDAILTICREYDVPVVEDAAEAVGAAYRGRPAGSFGELAVLSFNGNKIITTSGGGMLVGDDKRVARARHLATQARMPVPHYEHEEVGYNYRLSNLLAAVGRAQLRRLPDFVARRRAINRSYKALLDEPGISFMPVPEWSEPNWWLTCALVDAVVFGASSEDVRKWLEEADIEARPLWKPMHTQPVFAGCRATGGGVSERLFAEGICLPSGSQMSDADVERVADRIRSTPRKRQPT